MFHNALFTLSIIGSITFGFVFLIKKLILKFFGANTLYGMYLLVFLVFVLPVAIEMPSVKNNESYVTEYNREQRDYKISMQSYTVNTPKHPIQTEGKNLNFDMYFMYIWSLGAVLRFSYVVLKYFFMINKLKRSSCQFSKDGLIIRKVPTNKYVPSPMLAGVLRPCLYIPDIPFDENHLYNVIIHEKEHKKRLDILFKWIQMGICCIHWFNPFIYLLKKETEKYCEISCDIKATRNMSNEEKTDYMKTILHITDVINCNKVYMTTSMASLKGKLIERFDFIKNEKRLSKLRCAVGVFSVLLVISVFILSGGIYNNDNLGEYGISLKLPAIKDKDVGFDSTETLLSEKGAEEPASGNIVQDALLNYIPEREVSGGEKEHTIPHISRDEYVSEIKSQQKDDSGTFPLEGIGFDNGVTLNNVVETLKIQGKKRSAEQKSDLKNEYVYSAISYKDKLETTISQLFSDENGNVTVMFDSPDIVYYEISFFEENSDYELAGYGVLSEPSKAYTFMGFDPQSAYRMHIKGATGDAYKTQADFIIY